MNLEVNNEHQRFLLNGEYQKVQQQNEKLQEAIKIGSEAEVEARDIILNLDHQNRGLENMTQNVNRINGNLTKGNMLINTMRRHEMTTKIIMYGAIV